MNQPEDPTFLADRLMVGADGAVYVVHTGTLRASPPDDLSHASAPRLAQRHSEGGEGGACFRYEVPRRDSGEPPICFKYSAEAPRRDGGEAPVCFKYSADVPRMDGGNGAVCFAY
jgi:hypothetical protein